LEVVQLSSFGDVFELVKQQEFRLRFVGLNSEFNPISQVFLLFNKLVFQNNVVGE
jgi:hypothetical protein